MARSPASRSVSPSAAPTGSPSPGMSEPRPGPSAERRSHVAWRIDSPESEGKSMTTTNPPAARAGSYRVGELDLNRIGYGAMQLAGPGVLGPPRDRTAAVEVLRTAIELGVNHIDTAVAYGPYMTNE